MASQSAKNSKPAKNSKSKNHKRGNNGGGNRTKVTPKKKREFLIQVAENGGNVSKASDAVAVDRKTFYEHRAKDKKFKEDWDGAVDRGIDKLEDEAKRRAFDGVDEPIFYQGVEVSSVRKYSDTLLIFLLKGHREKYRERHEITGADGQPMSVRIIEEKVER